MAIAALVLAIIALVVFIIGTYNWYIAIPALILGIVALVKDSETKTEKDKKIAKIAIGISAGAMIISFIWTIVAMILVYA